MNKKMVAVSLGLAVLGCGLVGCTERAARQTVDLYDSQQYVQAAATLAPTIEKERTKQDENYVLNNLRYGSCTIAAGQFDAAKHAFFDAYRVINSGDTNDSGRQLSAAVMWEGVKVWKGEPYERVMADYYQAVLYLMDHNYGNARAAFTDSLFKLRENASKDDLEHYQAVESRFALGYFGLGYCNLRMGRNDLADTNFGLAQKYDPQLSSLIAAIRQPGVNAVLFVDAGRGPRKAARGWYNEESVFGPTPAEAGPIIEPVAFVDGRPVTDPRVNYATVDTLAMAQDRRWMDIDTIRKFKAVVGTGAMAAGGVMAEEGARRNNSGLMWAGIGTTLAGMAIAASSQADTRYWELLPRTVYIIPVTLTPGTHEVLVQAGPSRATVQMTYVPPTPGAAPQDAIFYFRLGAIRP